jgi:hypothetical protein
MSLTTDTRVAGLVRRSGARLTDVRAQWLWPALIGLSAAVFAALLYLTSYKNFFYDEWDFIYAYRPGESSTSIFFPHGEHWSTIPILIWKALFVLVGLRSHVPYQAIVVGAHVACVLALFALIRRRSGDLPAFAAALILLVLGTGSKEIVLAFQGNQTLSLALGLLALLMVEGGPAVSSRWRIAAISGLLLLSLMSSGLGLGFVVAITVELLLDRSHRHLLLAIPAPLGIYIVWFLAYGAIGSPCDGCPSALADIRAIGPGYLVDVARFVAIGLGASIMGLIGLIEAQVAPLIVQAGVVALAALLAWHWYLQGGANSWELGLLAGLVAQFTLIALARVHFGLEGAADSRYVYIGVVYLLPLVANAVKHVSWRFMLRPVWAGALALVVLSNAAILADQSLVQLDLMRTENAELRVVEMFRGAPGLALDRPLDDVVMPQLTAARYYGAIDELGSPVPSSVPHSLDKLPPRAVDQQLVALFGQSLSVTADNQRDAPGSCRTFDTAAGLTIDTQVPEGRLIMLKPGRGGDASLSLGIFEPPRAEPVLKTRLDAGTQEWVRVPNTGRSLLWRLRVRTAPVGDLQVCGVDSLRAHSGTAVFSASAAGAGLDSGWTSVPDATAYGGSAARLAAGTVTSSWRDAFIGPPTIVPAGSYDVWYRVRVTDASGSDPEMILGLLDHTTYALLGQTTYKANEVRGSYAWFRVARGVTPISGHPVVFVAEFSSHTRPLSTDWFIDEAMLVAAGSQGPSEIPSSG